MFRKRVGCSGNVEVVQETWRLFSSVGGVISTAEGYHPVLWQMFRTVTGIPLYCRGYSVLWRTAISTVEG